MSTRQDIPIQDYGGGLIQLTNGVNYNGPLFSMAGIVGCTVQILSPGAAAGTCFILGSNFYGVPYGTANQASGQPGMPIWTSPVNGTLNAGGSLLLSLNPTSPQLYFANSWVFISPSATGPVYISVNIRRPL